jgi:glycerol kinase
VFGNTDTWLIWNLTGGPDGGLHVTDPTNASPHHADGPRDARLGRRADQLLQHPAFHAAEIVPSSDPEGFGKVRADGPLGAEVAITGVLGDQQAATVGQVCFAVGEAKNTYGTGNFMLLNTGEELVRSKAGTAHDGLLPVRRQQADLRARGLHRRHGLRDPVAARPARHHRATPRERDAGAQVDDNGDVFFVPAFSGPVRSLLALRRARRDRRAVALQHQGPPGRGRRSSPSATRHATSPRRWSPTAAWRWTFLKVDGGATANDLLMQLQSDILGVPVSRPWWRRRLAGGGVRGGPGVGFWNNLEELRQNWNEDKRWEPTWSEDQRETGYAQWKKAVERTLDWVDVG